MNRIVALLAAVLWSGVAIAAQAPDTPVVTGPNNAQVPVGNLLVTPTGGTQTTIGAALGSPSITAGTIAGGTIAAMRCDGATDDTAAFVRAVATGSREILVPVTAAGCIVSASLVPQSGQTISGLGGGMPWIKLVSGSVGRIFNLTGLNNVTLSHLKLDGTNAAANIDFIRFLNTTSSHLVNSTILNPPGDSATGCIILAQASTDNEISENNITGCGSSAIIGNNANVTRNKIHHNTISGAVAFGIRMLSGANRNEISNNIIPQSGIEPIAVSLGAQYNRIIGNHVEGSGDNGISIVGDHNIISDNYIIRNAKAGIFLWGSSNTVIGNNLLDNNLLQDGWNCIGIGTNYGAAAQNNVVKGNTCDDDQTVPTQLGIGINLGLPTLWTTGTPFTSGAYVYYGLNLYLASSTGTSGASAPTCTSGTCSDGTVTWTYQSSYLTQAGPFFNDASDNRVIRSSGPPFTNIPVPSAPLNRNPDFLISQANLDSATSTTVNTGTLVIDGWRTNVSNGNQFVYQRTTTSLSGYAYAYTATANTNFSLLTTSFFQLIDRIEGINIGQLNWGAASGTPAVLDLCLNTAGVTGKIAVVLDNGGGGGTFYSYVMGFNVPTVATWTCFSQAIPAPPVGSSWTNAAGAIGARLALGLGAGSTQVTATYGWNSSAAQITGPSDMAQPVTVLGSVVRMAAVHLYQAGATYVPRAFGTELSLATRWFYSTFAANTLPHQNAGLAGALCTVNPIANGTPSLFVAPPAKAYGAVANQTITTFNPSASNANWRNVTAGADVVVSVDPASAKGANGVLLTTGATVANAGDVLCIHVTIDGGL
jgi:parallel beta-helix repeat protein